MLNYALYLGMSPLLVNISPFLSLFLHYLLLFFLKQLIHNKIVIPGYSRSNVVEHYWVLYQIMIQPIWKVH